MYFSKLTFSKVSHSYFISDPRSYLLCCKKALFPSFYNFIGPLVFILTSFSSFVVPFPHFDFIYNLRKTHIPKRPLALCIVCLIFKPVLIVAITEPNDCINSYTTSIPKEMTRRNNYYVLTINSFKYVNNFILLSQAVAMQQMYAQYVNQYMLYLQSAGGHFAAAGIHTWNGAAAGVAHAAVHDPRQVILANIFVVVVCLHEKCQILIHELIYNNYCSTFCTRNKILEQLTFDVFFFMMTQSRCS